MRVAIYLGCKTGVDISLNGETYNLIESTVNKGAHFALGTTQAVYTSDSAAFIEGFVDGVSMHKNMLMCTLMGRELAGPECIYDDEATGAFPVTYRGDGYQYLKY